MRRRTIVAAALTAGVAVLASVGVAAGSDRRGEEGEDRATVVPASTAEVTRRDLTEREELDGTLGYGDTREITISGSGTITGLADEGSDVESGQVLAAVDGAPVLLLAGEAAAWRDLDAGTSEGEDVRQLEQNLVELGYGTAEDLGPDSDWTSATTAAVKRLQAAIGAEEDGTFELGSVVFAAGAVRIAAHLVEVGASTGAPALEVTGTTRVVTVDLPAADQGLVADGQAVEVELPDGTTVDGTVFSVADVVDPPDQDGGEATVAVVIALEDDAAAASVDQAPVDVNVVTVSVEDALTVPVEALLALAEGGYAVERPDGSLVGVDVGAFADGFVQITPTTRSLDEGDAVVVAS
jgi:peptidoglycan hydrolase-like protein with peptidoglycan-binding domain